LWGGDAEGGGPYIFARDDDPEQLQGFEVELVAAVARELGLQPQLVQTQWDKLPDMLRAGKIDVVVNGIEDTPERAAVLGISQPYFVYALQLLVRKDDAATRSWLDLKRPRQGRPARIGVLTGSMAETWMRTFCQEKCEVASYDGNTDAMREVETGKLDATLQDTPIVQFYAPRFPALVRAGEPVGKGLYVALFRQDNPLLRQAFDRTLHKLIQAGELQHIYQRYGLWDDLQVHLLPAERTAAASDSAPGPQTQLQQASKRVRGMEVWHKYGWMLVQAAGLTIVLTLLAFPLAVVAGLGLALVRLYGPRWAGKVVVAVVEVLRGTPLMLQLYCLFFLLPEWGVNLPAFATGVLGLAINYAASESELLRAGLQSVPAGQYEAALSVGLSRRQALRHVVIPQAFRTVLPPLVSDFIAMFKDTSVCSAITLIELTKRFQVLSMSTQATVELMALTALLYLAMSYPLARLAAWLEVRMAGDAGVQSMHKPAAKAGKPPRRTA
jgi:polar amino acid transport system substrate-binding protein